MDTTAIVVGADGAAPSHAAVRWAAREAFRRDVELWILHAYDWNWPGARYDAGAQFRDQALHQAAAVTTAALEQARTAAPDVRARTESVIGNPVPILLRAATRAALVVLGSRGRGGFASLLLGSVSQRVATHSSGSVVVVRGRPDTAEGPVVVGVADSPTADDVLATAFESAAARDNALVAIRTYLPPAPLWLGHVPPGEYAASQLDAAERDRLAEQLAGWRHKYPQVPVEALVSHGGAAAVLVGVSRTAQLIVVGSRSHGTVAGILLGATGLQLLQHADCPVLIARQPAPQ